MGLLVRDVRKLVVDIGDKRAKMAEGETFQLETAAPSEIRTVALALIEHKANTTLPI